MSYIMFPATTDLESKLPVYLVGVGNKHPQEHVIRPNGYPFLQWIQCRDGAGELIIEGKILQFTKESRVLKNYLLFAYGYFSLHCY